MCRAQAHLPQAGILAGRLDKKEGGTPSGGPPYQWPQALPWQCQSIEVHSCLSLRLASSSASKDLRA